MILVEEEQIDAITAVLHQICTGKVPSAIPIPPELPDNEIRQLLSYMNRFLAEFAPFAVAMQRIARGELDTGPLGGRMSVVHSLKTLQSNLRHLTWKTQQIAGGDMDQQVAFMGDFSAAFNSMAGQLKESRDMLLELNKDLDRRNRFIRETFGRFTGDEIVDTLLDMPDGLKLGGEKREVTLLMSDLRGFTALVERMDPSEVVAIMNHYLTAMIDLVQLHGGTVDEIIGDAILVLFGAPVAVENASGRAVRCALEMQAAMEEVNEENRRHGWPPLEMGIALHTGSVVVGNIGSIRRSKYAVVGHAVNLTARIESFTVGGQVLASPALIESAGQGLILGEEVEVHGKGMVEPLLCRELLGCPEAPPSSAEKSGARCTVLSAPLLMQCIRLTGKRLENRADPALLVGLSKQRAEVVTSRSLKRSDNIVLRVRNANRHGEETPELYAKVVRVLQGPENTYLIHFTSVSPGMRVLLGMASESDGGAPPGNEVPAPGMPGGGRSFSS